jgi:hypothetical protein
MIAFQAVDRSLAACSILAALDLYDGHITARFIPEFRLLR